MCCIAASLPCCNLYQLPQFPLDTGLLLALQAVLLPVHCTPQLDSLELCVFYSGRMSSFMCTKGLRPRWSVLKKGAAQDPKLQDIYCYHIKAKCWARVILVKHMVSYERL